MHLDETPNAAEHNDAAPRRSRLGGRRMALATVLVLALLGGWMFSTRVLRETPTANAPESVGQNELVSHDPQAVQRITDLADLPAGPVEHVEVAYFHRPQRCHSCIEAERLTRETLDSYFADGIEAGDISLEVADVSAPESAALVGTYDAWTSSLYLGVTKGGVLHVFPVSDMWLDINDEARFKDSLRLKIETIIGSV